MGGTNQATCNPPPAAAKPSKKQRAKTIGSASFTPIRFHENQPNGEVHFHDDSAKVKCAVDSASFFSDYHAWRASMSGNLALAGHDGKGGHSRVEFMPYVDDNGDMQVAITVDPATMGQTVKDLDKMAKFP